MEIVLGLEKFTQYRMMETIVTRKIMKTNSFSMRSTVSKNTSYSFSAGLEKIYCHQALITGKYLYLLCES